MTEGHTERLETALDGKYRIERKLGEGGMATVYLAEDIKHKRKVALKILRPELAAVIGAERFLTEITTTANLQHPHILPLFDSGAADGYLYYVMPFIDGETLGQKLNREKQLSVDEAVKIAKEVGDALDYAHRNGVIHRDIKPANILLNDGRPVVADFGIALAVSAAGGGRMTETGLSLGTPHYMSPEQASADRDLSARSDVYSLGCVLYEMLAGQPPHTGPSAQSILVRILTEDPRPLIELRRTVPANVGATVMKSIEKLPADRFDSARQFIDALEDVAFVYEPTVGTKASTAAMPAAAPAASAGPRFVVPGLTATTILFAGLAAWGFFKPPPAIPADPATLARVDVEDVPVDQVSKVIISPDGAHLAVISGDPGSRTLWVRNVDEERFRLLWGGGDARYPAFSPGGDWIVYEDDGDLMRVALSGGAPRAVVPESAGLPPFQPHWGDDGTIVFVAGNGIYRVPETGGVPTLVAEGGTDYSNPHLLPGGRGLLFSNADVFTTYYMDLEADSATALIPGGIAAVYVETGHVLYVDQQGGLWALPFDLDAGEATGEAIPILQGIVLGFDRFARFSVSRTGTLVYGTGGLGGGVANPLVELLVVGLDGDEQVLPLAPRVAEFPRWSPDGDRIAYGGTEAGDGAGALMIYEYNVELRSTPRRLTFDGTVNTGPVYSPDGTRLAFSAQRDASQGRDVFLKNVFDDSPPDFLVAARGREQPTEWLEGDLLVFNTGVSGSDNDTWTVQIPDSSTSEPYLTSERNALWARVAPQGDLAAYAGDESGRMEIYVRSFPVGRQPATVSSGGGNNARWSPDGNTIYYWKEVSGSADSLFAATVQREPAFAVLSIDFVLAGDYVRAQDWDLHPDGDRFVTTRLAQSGQAQDGATPLGEPERHLIVTNWFTELLAAVGGGN